MSDDTQPTVSQTSTPANNTGNLTEIPVQKTQNELALEKAKALVAEIEARLLQERELVNSAGAEEKSLALYLHGKFCPCRAENKRIECDLQVTLNRNLLDWNTAAGREWLAKAAELVKDMPSTGWKVE